MVPVLLGLPAYPCRFAGGHPRGVKRKPAAAEPGRSRTPALRYRDGSRRVAKRKPGSIAFHLKVKPAAALSKSARTKARTTAPEAEYFALRNPGPRRKPCAALTRSGLNHRRRVQSGVKVVIIGAGWGRCGSMNFAANCGKQGFNVTHEVDCGSKVIRTDSIPCISPGRSRPPECGDT